MTTTEIRPSAYDAADDDAKPRARPPSRRNGALVRRLPYALAVVGIAIGYGVGHGIGASSARPAAPVKSAVTPEQISRALTGSSSGAAPVDDRGYSKLENGVQHTHGFELPVTPADRTQLAHQMDVARETALQYPTLADAEQAGLRRAGPFSPGLGTHMISYSNYRYAAGASPMSDDQIRHPIAWIYDGTKPDSRVAGLFYQANAADPAGFAGPNDVWHQHKNVCVVRSADGGIDTPLGADRDATQAQCAAVGGLLIAATGPLLHVWVVPGYEDSQGVFSHLNPAITCDDGTYHTIDPATIGTRTSLCVDGSE